MFQEPAMAATGAATKARIELDRAARIVLSERDTLRVMELLENPPEPPPALMNAARRRAARTTAADSSKKVK
jgi:uncharacterized protein (DUF1778 family)